MTYGPSKIQVADLLRTPFTNAEKWRFALNLMSHVASKRAEPRETERPQSASPGKPRPLWRAEVPGNQGCLSTQMQPCRDYLNGRHRKVRFRYLSLSKAQWATSLSHGSTGTITAVLAGPSSLRR